MSAGSAWRRRLVGEWNWRRPFRSAGFVYGSLLIVAVFFADRLIFVPPSPTYGPSHPALRMIPGEGPETEAVAAFWYPPPEAEAPVLLWTHGNAEDLGNVEPLLQIFSDQGVGVLAIDYPGYGSSAGRPTEDSACRATETALHFLTEAQGIAPERILLVGQSVGGGPAVWLAERNPELRGLVLISPFLSAFRVVLPFPLFPGDRFPNRKRMPKVTIPLLLFHGEEDEVISFSHGKTLFGLHPGPQKAFVPLPGTGHNDLWAREFDTVLTGIMDFALLGRMPVEATP